MAAPLTARVLAEGQIGAPVSAMVRWPVEVWVVNGGASIPTPGGAAGQQRASVADVGAEGVAGRSSRLLEDAPELIVTSGTSPPTQTRVASVRTSNAAVEHVHGAARDAFWRLPVPGPGGGTATLSVRSRSLRSPSMLMRPRGDAFVAPDPA